MLGWLETITAVRTITLQQQFETTQTQKDSTYASGSAFSVSGRSFPFIKKLSSRLVGVAVEIPPRRQA
jgi:hypothetical protein